MCGQNSVTERLTWKSISLPSFAGGRLTFRKLALALVGFSWCAWNFFGKPRVAKPLFLRAAVAVACN